MAVVVGVDQVVYTVDSDAANGMSDVASMTRWLPNQNRPLALRVQHRMEETRLGPMHLATTPHETNEVMAP